MFRVAQVDRDDLCVKLRGEKRRSSNSNDRRGRQPAGTGRAGAGPGKGDPARFSATWHLGLFMNIHRGMLKGRM